MKISNNQEYLAPLSAVGGARYSDFSNGNLITLNLVYYLNAAIEDPRS